MISRDTDAEVHFLTAVFNAVETPGSRMLDADGDMGHVEVELGDSGHHAVRRQAFGERVARVRDPQGHLCWVHERVEDVSPDDLVSRFSDPAAQEAMAYVQGTLRDELGPTARTGTSGNATRSASPGWRR